MNRVFEPVEWKAASPTVPGWLLLLSVSSALMGWLLFLVPLLLAQFVDPGWSLDIFPWMAAPSEPKILLIGTYVAGVGLAFLVAALLVRSLGGEADLDAALRPGGAALAFAGVLAILGILGVVLLLTLGRCAVTAFVLLLPLAGWLWLKWGGDVHGRAG